MNDNPLIVILNLSLIGVVGNGTDVYDTDVYDMPDVVTVAVPLDVDVTVLGLKSPLDLVTIP